MECYTTHTVRHPECSDTVSGFVDFESGPRKTKHSGRDAHFGETKEWTTMTTRQANKEYILVPRDLEGLPFMEKTSAYSRYDHRGGDETSTM